MSKAALVLLVVSLALAAEATVEWSNWGSCRGGSQSRNMVGTETQACTVGAASDCKS